MKVLTFNIHKGFDWTSRRLTIRTLKEQLEIIHPDLVFLQEVVGENLKLEKSEPNWVENQFEFLADQLWSEFAYAKNAVYDQRHHGNVILSRYPILESRQIDISTNKLEQRGVLFAKIDHPKDNIDCYCVHLDLSHRGRKKQYNKLSHIIKSNTDKKTPLILAGDFNDWNKKACEFLRDENQLTEIFKALTGQYAKTFPSIKPVLSLDRFYIRSLTCHTCQVLDSKPWRSLSDHLALYMEVDL